MSLEQIFPVLQNAGTIIYNNHAHIYFDLNGKSGRQCQGLKDVLQGVARHTNSQIFADVPHPMTQSSATIQLVLNTAQPSMVTNQFVELLRRTGNAYFYDAGQSQQPGALSQVLGRFAHDYDDTKTIHFMNSCKKMPTTANGASGRSLYEHVVLAVALNADIPDNVFAETVHVPLNLYGLDSVKARGIEAFLRGGATVTKGTYTKETLLDDVNGQTWFHVVKSRLVAERLASAKSNVTILMEDDLRQAVESDVARFSTGSTKVSPAPLKKDMGSILADLGIQAADTGSIAGISLMGRAP